MDDFMDFMVMKVLLPLCLLFVFCLIGLVPFMVYDSYKESSSPTFDLRKSDWICSKQEKHIETTYIMTGKVMMPYETVISTCVQWSHV